MAPAGGPPGPFRHEGIRRAGAGRPRRSQRPGIATGTRSMPRRAVPGRRPTPAAFRVPAPAGTAGLARRTAGPMRRAGICPGIMMAGGGPLRAPQGRLPGGGRGTPCRARTPAAPAPPGGGGCTEEARRHIRKRRRRGAAAPCRAPRPSRGGAVEGAVLRGPRYRRVGSAANAPGADARRCHGRRGTGAGCRTIWNAGAGTRGRGPAAGLPRIPGRHPRRPGGGRRRNGAPCPGSRSTPADHAAGLQGHGACRIACSVTGCLPSRRGYFWEDWCQAPKPVPNTAAIHP